MYLIYKGDPGVGALLVASFPPWSGRWEPKGLRSRVLQLKTVGSISGTAHKGPGGPTRAQGGPQGPGPQGPSARAERALDPSIYIYACIYTFIYV